MASESETMRGLVERLEGLIALKRGAPLHEESEVEARWIEEAIAALRAPSAEAKDAERYRYLRRRHVREWVSDMPENKGAPSLDIDFDAPGHDLDAAVDAAIAQQEASRG